MGQRQLYAAAAGLVQPGAYTLGVAAQLALVYAPGQGLLQQRGRGQRGQQLGVDKSLNQGRRCRQETDAPTGCQYFCKAADIDGAPQAIQCAEAGGVVRRNVAVSVIFDDMEIVRVGQLQHTVGTARREAIAGGVVEHADADKELGRMQLAVARHHLQVGSIGTARHGQDAHTQSGQARKFDSPAGLFDHHVVARAQQCTADDIQSMGGAHRGHDLVGCGVHVVGHQLL